MKRRTSFYIERLDDRCLLSLSPAVNYAGGTSPQDVVTADFNNDSILDVAVANTNNGMVSVLLGKADGTLQAAISSSAGNQPSSLSVGDFNDDGNLDLATGDPDFFGTADVTVLLGKGNGSFQAPAVIDLIYQGNYVVDKFVTSVSVGDFNGDGKLDIGAVTNSYDDVFGEDSRAAVLLGTGTGTFGSPNWSYISLQPSYSATVADFNADGKLDIASTNSYRVFIALGTGTGYFNWQTNNNYHLSDATVYSIVAADVNNDGKVDLVAAGGGSGGSFVSVLLGSGNGTFGTTQTYNSGSGLNNDLAVADFNGDGNLDLIAAANSNATGTVRVLLGTGSGAFNLAVNAAIGAVPTSIAVGDFNGDGKADAASANSTSNTVSVLLNDGNWDGLPLPPCVSGKTVTINGGASQRSRVTSVTIDFDQVVMLPANPADAFQLKRQSDNALVALTANVVNDSVTHVTLTFTGALSQFGSLEDGRYTVTVFASKVSNANGKLDGDCNGTGGDDFVLASTGTTGVFRLFGDADGDSTVTSSDFAVFRTYFGLGASIFDFNNDGQTNANDFSQFRLRFGLGLP